MKLLKLFIEVRPGEGGNDAKLLVEDQCRIYLRYAKAAGLESDIQLEGQGSAVVTVSGEDGLVRPLFGEAGGHRWQRVPPTEKRGRVHTSTVTVAVFEAVPERSWALRDLDIGIITTKDSGPGGQHRNTTESAVIMRHIPTGITVKAAEKSQIQNRKTAREMLESRVSSFLRGRAEAERSRNRREMVGSGMRGDKIRTLREADDMVTDHRTGRKVSLKAVRSGNLGALWAGKPTPEASR